MEYNKKTNDPSYILLAGVVLLGNVLSCSMNFVDHYKKYYTDSTKIEQVIDSEPNSINLERIVIE